MEPLTASLTFSTIVGLIGQFRSERGSRSQANFQEFLIWLTERHHDEVRSKLEENAQLGQSVKSILADQHDELIQRLESLDSLLVSLASGFSEFRELGLAARPNSSISEQALSILSQFERSGASKVLEMKGFSGTQLMYLDGNGNIDIEDWRFLEDDLQTLVELGLLRHDLNGKGQNLYILTREAASLVRSSHS